MSRVSPPGLLALFSVLGIASLASLATAGCLSSSTSPPTSTNAGDAGAPSGSGASPAVDSGAGCNAQVLVRCQFANGACNEYSGPSIGEAGDPFDCVQYGGTLADGVACARAGAEGTCVAPSGLTTIDGAHCEFFLTTWLPVGYDSGVAGNNCATSGGTYVPN